MLFFDEKTVINLETNPILMQLQKLVIPIAITSELHVIPAPSSLLILIGKGSSFIKLESAFSADYKECFRS